MGIAFDKSRKTPEERVLREQVPITTNFGTFVFLMTNDYTVIVQRLKSLSCRPPLPWEFSPRPNMDYEFIEKMESFRTNWALLMNANDSALFYYDEAMGLTFKLDLIVLSLDREMLSAEKMRLCIMEDKTREIEELVKSGYDINQILCNDVTPLHSAVGFNSYKSVRTLLKLGADVNARTSEISNTPLLIATIMNFPESAKILLDDKNIDLEARNCFGNTALIMAVFEGNLEMVRLLIEAGADINATDNASFTPLIRSIAKKHDAVSSFLIDSGADVNHSAQKGITAFIASAFTGNASIAEKLLKAGADCGAKDETGRTALAYAIYSDFADYIEWYLKNIKLSQADYAVALFHCAEAGSCKAASVLLRSTQSIEDAASYLLAFAAIYDNANIISICMDNGCDINMQSSFGMTALMIACYAGSEVFADTLIALGAGLNIADDYGMTAMMYAVSNGNVKLVNMLLENGADGDMRDNQGKTFEDYVNEPDHRSYDEMCRDRILSISDGVFARQDSQSSVPSVKQTFNGRFDWYMQKYFERFPDKKPAGIYKDGAISKKTFSKIQSNRDPDYRPQKDMVLSLALGLKLSVQETEDFVRSAGYTLSDSDKADFKIKRIIADKVYNSCDWSRRFYEETGQIFFRQIANSLQVKAPPLSLDTEKKSSDKLVVEERIQISMEEDSVFFFMTNDYTVLTEKLKGLSCRAPLFSDFMQLQNIPKNPLYEKMKSLGATWALTVNINDSYVVYYNGTNEPPFCLPIKELLQDGDEFPPEKMCDYISDDNAAGIERLVKSGFDLEQYIHHDLTALDIAINSDASDSLRTLLKLGADVNRRDPIGTTPLMRAALYGSIESTKILLADENIDLEAKDIIGWTALTRAAYSGSLGVMRLLIDAGADINSMDNYSWTPLLVSLAQGKYDAAELLIDSGADVTLSEENGITPLMHTAIKNDTTITERLIKAEADAGAKDKFVNEILTYAVRNDSCNFLDVYLKNTDVNSSEYEQAIKNCAEEGKCNALSALLRNSKASNRDANSALQYAAIHNHTDIIPICMTHGCDINIRSTFGMTALMKACYSESVEFARRLIDLGADPNITDDYGMTALMYAASKNKSELVDLLLENDADRDIKDKRGKTFEDYYKYDNRSFEELCDDKERAITNKRLKKQKYSDAGTISPNAPTFRVYLSYCMQKYFGRFPDKKPADIYKDGGISKKTFSKILNNRKPGYRPKKDTALLLVLGLRLSLREAEDFLQNAGYKLSDKDEVDAVVKELLSEGNHDKFDWSRRIYGKTGRTFFKSEGM